MSAEAIRDAVAQAIYRAAVDDEHAHLYKWELLSEESKGYYRQCADAAIRALYQFSVESVAAYAESEARCESLR